MRILPETTWRQGTPLPVRGKSEAAGPSMETIADPVAG